MKVKGLVWVGTATDKQGDYVWAHFRGPDERIYGLTSGPYEKAPAS